MRSRLLPNDSRWSTGATAVLTFIPWAALVAIAWHYTVDVIYWDEWELVPVLDKAIQGTLSFTDMWAQHNEHRPFFPRLLMVGLARATGWNAAAEVVLNVAAVSALVPVLWWTLHEGTRQRDVPLAVLTWPTVSLLVFSPSQWQNWLWGWQFGFFLHVASAVLGLALLCRRHVGWGTWTLAALLGIVGSFSFASGLLYWPVALVVLLVRREPARWWRATAWAVVAILVSLAYAHGWQPNPHLPTPATNFTDRYASGRLFDYALTLLGSPLAPHSQAQAYGAGGVGVALFAWLTWRTLIAGRPGTAGLLPFALGLMALTMAATIAMGRAGFGIEQALESRYVTVSMWLWVSVTLSLASVSAESLTRGARSFSLHACCTVATVALAVCLVINSWHHGLDQCREWQRRLSPAREALIGGTDMRMLQRLYPIPEILMERRAVLQRWHLSVFRGASDEPQP